MNDENRSLPEIPTTDVTSLIPEVDQYNLPQVQKGTLVPLTPEQVMLSVMPSASSLQISAEEEEILFSPVTPSEILIREDGPIYLPWGYYAAKLRKAFGTEWAIVPESPMPKRQGNNIIWGHYLMIRGVFIAYALGESEYHPSNARMSWSDATEAAVSNALMRCCKRLGLGSEVWDREFAEEWRSKYSETYINQKGKLAYRKKPGAFGQDQPPGQNQPSGQSDQDPESRNAPPDDAPYETQLKYWRSRAMATSINLGMGDEDLIKLISSHIYLLDAETGKTAKDENGEFIPVTRKRDLYARQWRKLGLELHKRWLSAGKPQRTKRQNEEAEAEAEDEADAVPPMDSKDAGENPFSESARIVDMVTALENLLDVHGLTLRRYIESNYVADFENLPDGKAEGIKDFLRTLGTDHIIRSKVKKDLKIWAKWRDNVAGVTDLADGAERVDSYVMALSMESPKVLAIFLKHFDIKSIRGISSEQFSDWATVLMQIKEDIKAEEESLATESVDADDDIPF